MIRNIFMVLLFAGCITRIASQEIAPAPKMKVSGFIKTDIFYDTRQNNVACGIREGHFFLFPENVIYDAEMNDLNANPAFHILNIQTRIKGDFTGPDVFGAITTGVIEAEFFGTSESDLNGFRLRHAFVKMDWQRTVLLIGQYWHPMFPAESFPGTISFNTGAPFTPFSRNPQVRLILKPGDLNLSLTAYSQRDFASLGPEGCTNKYLRNSKLPGMNIQLRVPAGDVFTGWAGFDYKKLRPEIKTSANAETDVTIGSFSAFSTLKIKTKAVTMSLMGIYSQNATDLVMLGGYAVSEITDTVKQFKTYTNLNTGNLWADLSTNGKKVAFGIFTGFSKNLGANKQITGPVYARGSDIDHLFRISPRVSITQGGLTFAAEVENTVAAYGTMQEKGRVIDTRNVNNIRILLSTIYRF
jgi:hypothetical protein